LSAGGRRGQQRAARVVSSGEPQRTGRQKKNIRVNPRQVLIGEKESQATKHSVKREARAE
jgi:hypothetical protein